MKLRIRIASVLLAAAFSLGAIGLAAVSTSNEKAPMTAREQAIHVLNRLGFGPRPGDVDSVLAIGARAWIDRQLKPEHIPDDAAAAALRRFPTLTMTTAELFDRFERPLREAQRESKRGPGGCPSNVSGGPCDPPNPLAGRDAGRASGKTEASDSAGELEKIRRRIPPENRPRRVIEELSAARIVRAAQSERQLNEVLVDFWMNHFNVFAGKGLDRVFTTSFERDVIRPMIWGRFEDLLLATAKSPAMLFYLDNAQSTADEAHRPPRPMGPGLFGGGLFAMRDAAGVPAKNPAGGLNENYARELMELHTLGVDGGYTQKDVTELARILTGWSIVRPEQGTGFIFRAQLHDAGSKTVLGNVFPAGGGIEEGERMIRILAGHPSTARHIAYQLCQRFVADDPPKALVDRVAKTFLATGGDLRETVRAVVTSAEFFDRQYYRAKVKSPFEYVVSALRAVGAAPEDALPIARQLAQMGEPLYLCRQPTGYSDTAETWVNTGALLARLNFALQLAANRLPGAFTDLKSLVTVESAADPKRSADAVSCALVGGELSPETRRTLKERIGAESINSTLPLIAGLILGSPEFQRQ
jgi:uncharacterized protein (DUF1800 family)